jgi:hypothetical protein
MAVASLTRFTVPVASDQSASAQGLLMPKLQYRFRVLFENFGVSKPTTELTKQVMDITRPAVDFDDITLDVYNSKVRLAGRHTWQDITVQIRDDAAGNVSRLVGEQLQRQFDFFEQSSAASGIDYKFTTKYEVLDGGNGVSEPNILETWEIYGCFIQNVNYNTLAYNTSDPATITMTLRFDNALQKPDGNGVGTPVTRSVGVNSTGS